ncbi:MAG TPA: ParB/RepB/Spo0J family partition protein [Candidatus Saccharimonadales bacterium]|nr:ParB/RepB/Spo0J family partition protein [Candidatus Saccharimonadales bacterium]
MAKKLTLGRGLDTLIPKDIDVAIFDEDKNRVQKLLISDILPNPDQPRREHGKKEHDEMTASIKRHGVLQPIIVVRASGPDSAKTAYRIVAGERRWRAAQAAKLTHIPAIIRSLEELEEIELALIENIQRVDLSPLEQALAVYKLQHQFNLELEKIAEKLGKAPSTVSNMARLLQLPDSAREALRDGKISEGHARAILALREQPAKQEELLSSILDNGWTVRQAEQFVVAARKGATSTQASSKTASETDLTKKLSHKLNTLVKIKHTAKGGQLIIHFSDEQELEKLAQKLQNSPEQ